MRIWVLVALVACGKSAPRAREDAARVTPPADAAIAKLPEHGEHATLAAALAAIIPADARVVGFGELHARTDRKQVKSALAQFTSDALPSLADKLSDLIVETWIVDGKCGPQAQKVTAQVTVTMRRPQETKSEIGMLADAARAAKIQPHAMRVTCADYEKIAPAGKDVDPEVMLSLTTRELARISDEAVRHRDKEAGHRPLIAVYGGALHNDRFPADGVADWSYAPKADAASGNHFVEIDLIVPELAAADTASQKQPWYPLVERADAKVRTWQRGERSFVVVLPKASP